MPTALIEQRWLTPQELAEKLGLSVRTLEEWRRSVRGPRASRISYRTVRYPAEDVESWLQELRKKQGREREHEEPECAKVRPPVVRSAQFPLPATLGNDRPTRYRLKSERR